MFTTPAAAQKSAPAKLSAQVGAFGEPTGAQANPGTAAGRAVRIGGAFEATPNSGPPGRVIEKVRATAFGENPAALSAPRPRPPAGPAHFNRGVGIVSKPRPRYTDEARRLGIEGEVVLEVLFSADGEVHVRRLVRGLGHGLDERAVEAAMLISFLPARREGKPVDIVATVRIQFQLA